MPAEYWTPRLLCKRQASTRGDGWDHHIGLPFPRLEPRVIDWSIWPPPSITPDWPHEDWCALVGCRECGLVTRYFANDVDWGIVVHERVGQYCADVVCIRVDLRCGAGECTEPVSFHTTIADRNPKSYDSLFHDLKTGLIVGQCVKGHRCAPAPRE